MVLGMADRLTLKDATEFSRLDDFIAQEEARGIGPADVCKLEEALSRIITEPRSEGQTSRSASFCDLSGTRTR